MIMYNNKLKVINTYDEQGEEFKTILATALKNGKIIQKQTVIKQKEETPNV